MKSPLHFLIILTILVSCDPHKSITGPKDPENKVWKSGVKCKIDGNEWERCFGGFTFPTLENRSSYFIFNAGNWCRADSFIHIEFEIKGHSFDTGIFQLNDFSKGYVQRNDVKDWLFETDIHRNGKLHISEINRKTAEFSGSFELEAYDTSNQKVIKITDGLFKDISYL